MSHLKMNTVRGKRINPAVQPVIEQLEQRQLLAASLTGAGLLTVVGSNFDDVITLSTAKNSPYIKVEINSLAPRYFYTRAVKGVWIQGAKGNDDIELHGNPSFTIPSTIYGGDGNDTILGGAGRDYIDGGNGDDRIEGGGWFDILLGGAGNDVILGDGSTGSDLIYPGPGANSVNSNKYDRVFADPKGTVSAVSRVSPNFPITTFTGIPSGYTPQQIRAAYSFGDLNDPATLKGDGQAIAIVDAYHTPNALADLTTFSQQFGLPLPTSTTFRQVSAAPSGAWPTEEPNVGGWSGETLLDIQWAHAIAPNATIILVEANSDLNVDMTQAIDKAVAVLNAGYGGGVISMSFGGPESIDKTVADASFLNLNTKNISFIAASGDTPVPSQPATNPNVLAVGGTALFLDAQGNRVGGSTVTTGANGLPSGYTDPAVGASVEGGERPWFMSGAGISTVYATPTYQQNRGIFLPMRGTPDVCYNADPVTGYPVWNSAGGGGVAGWTEVGGTSAAAPQWAALVALANQYRAQKGQVKLGDQLVNKLYSLGGRGPDAYFNDIDAYGVLPVQNGYAYPAGTGWDLASGWGSPRARTLIPALADQALVFTNTTAKLSSASLTVFDPTVPMSVTNPGFTYVRTNTSGTIQGLNTLNFNPGTFTLLSTGNGSNTSTSTLTMFGLDSFGVGAAGNPIVLERIGNELSGSGQFLYTYTTSTTTGGTGGTGGTTTTTTTTVGGRLRFTGSIANGGVSLSFVTVDANGNEIKSSVYKDPVNPTAVVIRVIGKFTN